ncbi:ABC transporter permease [Georgenia sp. 311]|uniref:ABC transporter permease n=1 Tax=Georgenia sp. 311 TaxID=2585134 RepID=UPI001112854C|nr:ABC transporter permease [Georgenia sp. 311]TNC18474.1 ABC transporter permease [Georgenia sp. 311]
MADLTPGVLPDPTARRRGQEHFFAELDEEGLGAVDAVADSGAPSTMWGEAWRKLRRRPLFWVAAFVIVLVCTVALFPSLFTSQDPRYCVLANSLERPRPGHPFGFDRQGCDLYSRVIYGARSSVSVGVLTTALALVLGTTVGALAGFFRGWLDSVLSRITDIFFAVPLVLGAIVFMQVTESRTIVTVVLVLAVFGWPAIARIARGSVMNVATNDYVTASRALGAGRFGVLSRHVLPNAAPPIIVYVTVALGVFIVTEATLSFLGVGLPPSVISWGGDISQARASLRTRPGVLFYPAGALALTVLGFIMMGDAVRDALDPRVRDR